MLNKSYFNFDADFYEYDNIPINRDIFIISESELEEYKNRWLEYLNDKSSELEHPNNYIDYKIASIQNNFHEGLELNVGINTSTRFHGVSRILPREKIIAFIDIWTLGDKPYLIVNKEWFDENNNDNFASYALVDSIGMKDFIRKHGEVDCAKISIFQKVMNDIASKYRSYFFLSYADSVIIKTNWIGSDKKYLESYKPEQLIEIAKKVMDAYYIAFNLDSYTILTQGANQSLFKSNFEISKHQNHVFFNSLGSHFAELFEIEHHVRNNIKQGLHSPKNLYIAYSFLLTLNFINYEIRDKYLELIIKYETRNQFAFESAYLPINIGDISKKIDDG